MSRLVIYAIIALAVVATITATIVAIYHKGYASGEAAVKLAWEQANRAQREKEAAQAATAATGLEKDRAKVRVVYKTITEKVDRIVDRPVYRNVCFESDGLCLANAAIRGESADSCKPAGTVPRPTTTFRWNGGHDLALDYGERGILSGLRGQAQASYRGD